MEYTDEKYPGVTFTIEATQDDMGVRGNLIDSGDPEQDRKDEDEIIARLDQGDVWAWASVRVVARLNVAGTTFEGDDYLGACSYADEADFAKPGGYWDDMKDAAYADLRASLAASVAKGEAARAVLGTPEDEHLSAVERETRASLQRFCEAALIVGVEDGPAEVYDLEIRTWSDVEIPAIVGTRPGLMIELADGRQYRVHITVRPE